MDRLALQRLALSHVVDDSGHVLHPENRPDESGGNSQHLSDQLEVVHSVETDTIVMVFLFSHLRHFVGEINDMFLVLIVTHDVVLSDVFSSPTPTDSVDSEIGPIELFCNFVIRVTSSSHFSHYTNIVI
jgi:hypothetical protein